MEKRPVNFRFPKTLLDKIKRESSLRGESYTQWVIDACRFRLGMETQSSLEDRRPDKRRIEALEKQIESLSQIVDYCSLSIESTEEKKDSILDIVEELYLHLKDRGEYLSDPIENQLEKLREKDFE